MKEIEFKNTFSLYIKRIDCSLKMINSEILQLGKIQERLINEQIYLTQTLNELVLIMELNKEKEINELKNILNDKMID